MGFARLGSVIQFVPYPVTVGFTSGIALLIAVSQGRDFFGLQMETVPAEFVAKIGAYAQHFDSWNPMAVALALGTIAVVQLWPRVTHRIPGMLVALIGATLLVQLGNAPVDTIATRFGGVPTRAAVARASRSSTGPTSASCLRPRSRSRCSRRSSRCSPQSSRTACSGRVTDRTWS